MVDIFVVMMLRTLTKRQRRAPVSDERHAEECKSGASMNKKQATQAPEIRIEIKDRRAATADQTVKAGGDDELE